MEGVRLEGWVIFFIQTAWDVECTVSNVLLVDSFLQTSLLKVNNDGSSLTFLCREITMNLC